MLLSEFIAGLQCELDNGGDADVWFTWESVEREPDFKGGMWRADANGLWLDAECGRPRWQVVR